MRFQKYSSISMIIALLFIVGTFAHAATSNVNKDSKGNATSMKSVSKVTSDNKSLTFGVYYYPWYDENFHDGEYIRGDLVPKQLPELGEYSDKNLETIKQHLKWCKYAGISVLVSSWWGPGKSADDRLREEIFPLIANTPEFKDMKVAIHYETTGRMKGDFSRTTNLIPDIDYMCDNYFNDKHYYKINGRPVIVMYLTRVLSANGTLASTLKIMRDEAAAKGYNLYIIGDQTFSAPGVATGKAIKDIPLLDGVTNYDVYASIGAGTKLYAGQEKVDAYWKQQAQWKAAADKTKKTSYIPAISPGFNDRGVRLDANHPALSRRLTPKDDEGSLFKANLKQAKNYVDPKAGNLILINSWNEWHEDSQIEPVKELKAPDNVTHKDISPTGTDLTMGVDYTAYGTLYLDILHNEMFGNTSAALSVTKK